ncbi:hypothetical protein BGZ49_002273 [Haplosporangium sp. Z 27]|nr:hypothetical protein BGZ49_002273 [Haplosporangium sp. Z 27]
MFKDSVKLKDLVINVHTGATIKPKGLPLIYGYPEEPTFLQATVSFEPNHDRKAKGVEITFKAIAHTLYYPASNIALKLEGEEVFYSKKWDLDVAFSKPGIIEKGSYSRSVSVVLDPTLPSSCSHFNGRVKYEFEARVKEGKGFGITKADIVVTSEVWVLNSLIPAMGLTEIPVVSENCWKNSLPFLVSIPSKILCFEQLVPVRIQLNRFINGTEYFGQEVIVSNMSFVLQESRTSRASYTKEVHLETERFVNISVNTGWPRSADGWERTIFISLPSSPTLSNSMKTRYLDIKHSLIVTMDFKTSKNKPERMHATLEVEITSPRSGSLAPPEYYGDSAQLVDTVLGIPTDDLTDELPSYARYET